METQKTPQVTVGEVLALIKEKQPNSGAKEFDVEGFMKNSANVAGKTPAEIAQSYLDSVVNVTI